MHTFIWNHGHQTCPDSMYLLVEVGIINFVFIVESRSKKK